MKIFFYILFITFLFSNSFASSEKELHELVKENKFREDLYHRIAVIELNVPKLDDRKDDIVLLVDHFLEQLSSSNENGIFTMDSKAIKLLTNYSWKGNVRELRNVVERLTILSENNNISSDDVKKFSGKK